MSGPSPEADTVARLREERDEAREDREELLDVLLNWVGHCPDRCRYGQRCIDCGERFNSTIGTKRCPKCLGKRRRKVR